MRPPQAPGGSHSAGLRTTGPDLEPLARADAYDGRARLAAPFGQAKPALGVVKRRPHQGEAQHLVRL